MGVAHKVRDRMLLICGTVAYVYCFQWIYINWLYPFFEYFGFTYTQPDTSYLLLGWLLSVSPSLWMPIRLTRPSQLAYWVLYITVIVPSMFVPLYVVLEGPPDIFLLMLTLWVGFVIAGAGYLLPLIPLIKPRLDARLFWSGFICIAGALVLWIILVFRENLHFVSFADVYELRSEANNVMEKSAVNYALMLLTGAINPFFMGWGLFHKRYWIFVIGVIGQILVYGALGTKGSILSIVFVLAFYFLIRLKRVPFGLGLVGSVVAMLSMLALSYGLRSEELTADPTIFYFALLYVVFMRTFAINGLMTAQYYDFFQSHPQTHYSHIKGVSLLLTYPYQNPIGLEVGYFYSGAFELNSTAHFWAMDGLAALGLTGVLLISILCALVFWVLDSAAQGHDPKLAALLTAYAAYNLANIPIFTSLLSGGLGMLILMLYLMPRASSLGVAHSNNLRSIPVRVIPPLPKMPEKG